MQRAQPAGTTVALHAAEQPKRHGLGVHRAAGECECRSGRHDVEETRLGEHGG